MASHSHGETLAAPGKYVTSSMTKTLCAAAMLLGVIGFAAALYTDSARAWHSYLTSYFYFTSIAILALFFTALQHVAKAGWSVNVRRFMEAPTAFLPIAAIGAVVLLFGAKTLYIWLQPDVVAHDPNLMGKSGYLNWGFFIVRLGVFFALWLLFQKLIVGNSIKQDTDGDENHTLRNVGFSIGFILVFALSFSFFSVDTLMSLQPHWYSTMWGVYCFAGAFQSTIAVTVILAVTTMSKGIVRGYVSDDHLHDLGKFMFAFTIFYAYIGFSQFLLIWYANLPEETIFFLSRSSGGWMIATLSLLFLKFILPFLLMLPKAAKRTHGHLIMVACIILIMQYVDDHWMVYPSLVNGDLDKYGGRWILSWQEISTMLMFGGAFVWSTTNFLSKNSIIPVKDPRIEESIHHHVTY